ncbi:uncharacterized protein GGS22DRAFT_149147 [Annulohypoxylon maeteangense]|uniref:uncharacterized protein n=1 Tax=Annulohypoxylon maeteangense TaxID=1927788 RepID=UPI00200873C0|nr:uncharacterized protein GGS22DRAFT_149147 [Annulohypoxylon maeteangense]KAI0889780.1 hypothetical protein GGS22DRAFT_149147 [Annulohypoxylon maeteangense]
MKTSQVSSGPLEDRLRNLILNNNDQTTPQPQPLYAPTPTPTVPLGNGRSPNTRAPKDSKDESQKPKQSSEPSISTQAPPKAGKKRPNQAQRRQMRAQLSIPIDTRAPVSHDGRSHHQQEGQRSTWHNTEQPVIPPNSSTYHGGFQESAHNPPSSQQRRHQGGFGQAPPVSPPKHLSSWRHQQTNPPDAFSKGANVISPDAFPSRGRRPSQPALYNPGGQRQFVFSQEQVASQTALLDELCHLVIAGAEIEPSEIVKKEDFRAQVEAICRDVISSYEVAVNGIPVFLPYTVELKCFGSLSSGFATKAADMDLGLLSPMSRLSPDSADSPIPRLVEKALLEHGFGARLLTRTRVPIIKLCEKPSEKLHQDLLEARVKWEKGLTEDNHEAVDDAIDDHDPPENSAAIATTEAEHLSLRNQRDDSFQPNDPVEKTYEEQLASLRQSETQSLMAYYGNAKRLLRRLSGRDITISNIIDFKAADFKLMDDISGAFVNGLYDKGLKGRVQSYPSFKNTFKSIPSNPRSLLGVLTMVEGEKIVAIWEAQTIVGANLKLKNSSENTVQAWKNLQNKRSFGTDPLLFNRELHTALEHLRQIPFVQLIQLKQDQYESPAQYHSRVDKIAANLGYTQSSSNATLLSQIIQHYISGIRDKQVRDEVQNFATSTGVQTLRTIARKHKAISLAVDYERAIERGLYHEEDIPIIREYIGILQGDFVQRAPQADKRIADAFDFIVPATKDTIAIVKKLKQLSDPSKLGPNQPRDRYHDSLEFPKNGIGVQCDINFSAHLALQNTLLLRCYAYTDPRVRPMVLFVKHWAKARGINTPYRGTLSSYGYVLMVLHYLVNIAEPFVCPNLQQLAPPDPNLPAEALEGITTCKGRDVRFWRDEQEIQRLAREGHLNQNRESLGYLLRGFFEYYAQNYTMSTINKRGFDWGRDVLSLRTHGGLLSKQEKGWIGAKTVMQLEMGAPPNPLAVKAEVDVDLKPSLDGVTGQPAVQARSERHTSPDNAASAPQGQMTKPKEFKEVRHRYLFAIEDPFELEHNVARTVTHNGIVSIRDEFRRAWRIIRNAGKAGQPTESLLDDVKVENEKTEKQQFTELLKEIHGPRIFHDPAMD